VTVAAVILAASVDSALADAAGIPRVRRLADSAWSGGATPIVVVAPDPDGAVALALAGAPVTLAAPAPPEGGPVAQIARGLDVARSEISATDAALVWPARMTWVGPETVTSLLEAHGVDSETVLRPAYRGEPGWPVLVPMAQLATFRALSPTLMPDELMAAFLAGGVAVRLIDLGDPGTTIDGATPREDLPPYDGPAEPAGRHTHEWGAEMAEASEASGDDSPLRGPALAPYGQAESESAE
jgi:CTP:molybdopterin cytidylyltransferase MocA